MSRLSAAEIRRAVIDRGIVASIGESTVWRWLSDDAIRPWYHRSWIFPRDPQFQEKAAPILDLYEGKWRGEPSTPGDFVISADERPASRRADASTGPWCQVRLSDAHRAQYERCGAWAYLAAWDVRRARLFGRCERSTGIAGFERLVHQVMRRRPYCSADRVCWIMDNGSSHRGEACVRRL